MLTSRVRTKWGLSPLKLSIQTLITFSVFNKGPAICIIIKGQRGWNAGSKAVAAGELDAVEQADITIPDRQTLHRPEMFFLRLHPKH